ncbi:hypothetical protein CK203_087035 [Vitis vinifera]|uniref:Gypsy retrotransposon integrase-like protein 1 n=1 Tax=Vitis vinifera TaxID=29760 RepID=A0A438CLR6_VITVI|nr:hypothetical protein CK203_087035 [Vitis vinifera]
MDIVGPLPAAAAKKKFLLIATDYFSKWVEVEAYASIKDKDVTTTTTIQTEAGRQDDANAKLGRNLDWADEVRETASIRMADYQQRAAAHYNRKARPRNFKSGTLVIRKVFENTVEIGAGKFQANWEGPYIVSKTSESGAYHLQKLDGTPLLRPWNVSNLKQYYQ